MSCHGATCLWDIKLPNILSSGSAYLFVEDIDQRPPWEVDIPCIAVGCVRVRAEFRLFLRIEDDSGGRQPSREAAKSSVPLSTDLTCPPPGTLRKPHA